MTSEEDEQAAAAGTPILLIAFSVLGSGIITDRFAPEAAVPQSQPLVESICCAVALGERLRTCLVQLA